MSLGNVEGAGEPAHGLTLPVTLTLGMIYARGAQPGNHGPWQLDEYAPVEPGPWPLVLLVSGGGTRDEWRALPKVIAARGAAVFVVDYPRSDPETAILNSGQAYRQMVEAVACAARFARATTAQSGGDTARLAAVGFSMGGGVAAQVALAGDSLGRRWDEYAVAKGGPPRQVVCEVSEGTGRVDALVGIAGAYDALVGYDGRYGREWLQKRDPDLWKMFYALVEEKPGLTVRLLHGNRDTRIPYANSAGFEALLRAAGYDVKLTQFEGDHTVPAQLTVETIMDVVKNPTDRS